MPFGIWAGLYRLIGARSGNNGRGRSVERTEHVVAIVGFDELDPTGLE